MEEKQMKKLFAFLLVVVMILSMMVGCGNNPRQ